jgi:hypothetical protein
VKVSLQVGTDSRTVHGLLDLATAKGLVVPIIHTAKLEPVEQDETSLREARGCSHWFLDIILGIDSFTAGKYVIDMKFK